MASAVVGAKTVYIERGSPGRTATSRASRPAFAMSCSTARASLREAQIVIENWRRHYNTIRTIELR
jgi:putative transposase